MAEAALPGDRDHRAARDRNARAVEHDHLELERPFRVVAKYVLPLLVPFIKYMSTPKKGAQVMTNILIDHAGKTGVYYDEGGKPMVGSTLIRDPNFTARVVAETRALLATVPA